MAQYSYQDLLSRMTDLSALSLPPVGEWSGCFSSHDRRSRYCEETGLYEEWGANDDGGGYIRKEEEGIVVFEMDGPGVIWRVWSALALDGHIRIYFDHAENPAIDMPFRLFFERFCHLDIPINYPNLTPVLSRGRNRFIPIPFNRHCKIVLQEGWGAYYHFTYTKFPQGTVLPEYNQQLEIEAQVPLAELDRAFQQRGELDCRRPAFETVTLQPGEEKTVWQDSQTGQITRLLADFGALPEQHRCELMRGLVLQLEWDGEGVPSVLSPVGDFFGTAPGYSSFRAWPLSMQAGIGESRWAMPYCAAKLVLRNETPYEAALPLAVETEALTQEQAKGRMRFHAKWHKDDYTNLKPGSFAPGGDRWPDWPMLLCRGKGRFCGVHLCVKDTWPVPAQPPKEWWYGLGGEKTIDWWWGEGDEKFFVDGEHFPSTFGTGSEDYIGYAWAAEPPHVAFDSAYACQSRVPIDGNGYTSVARFHICDSIPFYQGFEAYIEKYKENLWGDGGQCLYACTAYWYQVHDGSQWDPYRQLDSATLTID